MMGKFANGLGYLVLAALAWWAWTGPLHDWRTVTPAEQTRANAEDMKRCLHGMAYVEGAGGPHTADPQAACAKRLNLYEEKGTWYRYDQTRYAGPNAG